MSSALPGSTRFSFTQLINRLKGYILQYNFFMYANSFLFDHILDDTLREKVKSTDYVAVVSTDRMDEGTVNLTGNGIIEDLEALTLNGQNSFEKVCEIMSGQNAHFVRTHILNTCYEIIVNYLEGFGEAKLRTLKTLLKNEDWFRVLHVLRNNASHFDNHGKEILWPYRDLQFVSWQSITINKGDIGHRIRYNDSEILDLLHFGITYLADNKTTFE